MLERLAILGLLTVVSLAGVVLARRLAGLRSAQLALSDHAGLWRSLAERPDGRPALVVFSTPACVACRTAQVPAVDAVRETLGAALRVFQVDIGERPEAARAFKVLTAPSTAILGGDGRLHRLNHGFASAQQLLGQLAGAARSASALSPQRPGQPAQQERAQASRR